MKNTKEKLIALKDRFGYSTGLALVSASLVVVPSVSSAVVPSDAVAALTSYITDATEFVSSFWPLVIAVVIGFSFMGLFKKGISKAT